MNRVQHILLLLAVAGLLVTGCKPGNTGFPEGQKQIPREQMVRLMADMELNEAALKLKQVRLSRDSVKKIARQSYDSLYVYYQVTPEQFKENLKYYQLDMDDFQEMLDEVIIELTQHKDSVSIQLKDVPSDTAKVKKRFFKPAQAVKSPKTGKTVQPVRE